MVTIKVLHAAVLSDASIGIIKQMQSEKNAAKLLEIPWSTFIHVPENFEENVVFQHKINSKNKILRYIKLRSAFYTWLTKEIKTHDIVLLRYSTYDPFQTLICFLFGKKILTVHHTKESEEIIASKGKIFGKILNCFEYIFGKITIKSVSGLIAVTEEILHFEKLRRGKKPIKNLIYPNGILFQKKAHSDKRKVDPELLFMAGSFANWHGLDMLFDSLVENNDKFLLHIVGDTEQSIKNKVKNDNRIIFHGKLKQKEIDVLMCHVWCGLSSFALHRQGMHEACTLKVREYLMSGLPVYSGHNDSALPIDFPYYKVGKPDITMILRYAEEMRDVKKSIVSQSAEQFISKERLLQDLYMKISKQYNIN